MRYVLYGLIGLVLTALAGGVFIYMAAPTGYVRDRLVAEVKSRTGRDLIVRGSASFTVYPRLGVELKDVSLSGPPGLEKEFFVRMEKLKLAIPLLPLMQRELAIDEFLLVNPVIQLAVDEKGRRTWDFTLPASAKVTAKEVPIRGTTLDESTPSATSSEPASVVAAPDTSAAKRKLTDMLQGFSLGNVRIEGGEVRYANLLTKSTQRFTQVDVKLSLSAIDAPFEATGSLVWRKQRLPFTAKLETLKAFLDGAPARLVLALDAEHLAASYDGKLDLAGTALLDGKLAFKTASVRKVAQWAQVKLPPVGGLGPLDLQTHLTIAGPSYTLAKAKLMLDGATATGDLALDAGGVRPMLKGKLTIDKLDLNVYLADAAPSGKVAAKPKKKKAKSDDAKSDATEPGAISDVDETASVSEAAEPVKPKKVSAGWSNAPIDVAGLKAIDADVTIAAGALFFQDIKLGRSRVVLALKDGLLKSRLPEIQAYGGKGLGTIEIDGQSAVPRVKGNATINGVSALPLLTDAMALDWVAGNGSISLGFTAQGRSQKALVQTLTGQGRFAFTDGAIVGLNIPQMVRGLGEGKVGGLQRDKGMKTDFSELSGTLSINKGIVTNKDLSLVGPLIRVAGAGTIDMPARSLDYAAMPKVVASLEGQGGEDATGFTIPVRIQGPWAKPKIVPDLEGLAKNPEAVIETVKQLGKKLKDGDKKKVKKVLEKLTGGKAGSDVENLIGGVLGQ